MLRLAFVIYLMLGSLIAAPASAQKRLALLIGNQDYVPKVGRLVNPINDVTLIAAALQKVGFKNNAIRIVRNADRITLLDAVDRYVEELSDAGKDAIGFFYYSGHGVANKRDRRNYLIPVGVKSIDRRVWFKAIALDDIVSKLSSLASNAAHFVVFDACRNLFNAPTRGGKGFVPVRARRGMLIAFSTDPGETASDDGMQSGPYAAALADELVKPGQDHLNLFQNVKEQVYRTTSLQVPWTRDGMLQRIYLGGKQAKPKPANPSVSRQVELAFWNSVKDSKNPEVVRANIARYPKGVFTELASVLINNLEKIAQKTADAERKELELREAEVKRRRAKEAEEKALLEQRQAKQFEALVKAQEEAARAKKALRKAEKEREAALQATKKARQQKEQAKEEAAQFEPEKLASLTTSSKPQPKPIEQNSFIQPVQLALKKKGCYVGRVDGHWGPQSKRALVKALGDAVSDVPIDASILARLNSSAKSCSTSTSAFQTKTTATINRTQKQQSRSKSCLSYSECLRACRDEGMESKCGIFCSGSGYRDLFGGRKLC